MKCRHVIIVAAAVAIIIMDVIAMAVHPNTCNVKIGMVRITTVSMVLRTLAVIISHTIDRTMVPDRIRTIIMADHHIIADVRIDIDFIRCDTLL